MKNEKVLFDNEIFTDEENNVFLSMEKELLLSSEEQFFDFIKLRIKKYKSNDD